MLFEKQYGEIQERDVAGISYSFIRYNDTTLTRVQNLLSAKSQSKVISGELFEIEQRLLYLLHRLLHEKHILSSEEKKSIQSEAKNLYAKYKSELQLGAPENQKLSQTHSQAQENASKLPNNEIPDMQDIQTFTKKSIKLSPDSAFLSLSGWLRTGDKYRVVSQAENTTWIEIEIVDSESQKSIGKRGYISIE